MKLVRIILATVGAAAIAAAAGAAWYVRTLGPVPGLSAWYPDLSNAIAATGQFINRRFYTPSWGAGVAQLTMSASDSPRHRRFIVMAPRRGGRA